MPKICFIFVQTIIDRYRTLQFFLTFNFKIMHHKNNITKIQENYKLFVYLRQ